MKHLNLSSDMRITPSHFGNERAPILIIDNFVEQSTQLIDWAAGLTFSKNSPFYPGIRAPAPEVYQQLILKNLQANLIDSFNLPASKLTLSVCQYSIITTPPEELNLVQRIPHFDSLDPNGLAAVHYLFHDKMGGTSFYRHKKTGFESINENRKVMYLKSLQSENDGPNMPSPSDGYINGNTALFERIAEQKGVFNRIIIYRRNSLHSGSIGKNFTLDPNPLSGRLSISTFLDPK